MGIPELEAEGSLQHEDIPVAAQRLGLGVVLRCQETGAINAMYLGAQHELWSDVIAQANRPVLGEARETRQAGGGCKVLAITIILVSVIRVVAHQRFPLWRESVGSLDIIALPVRLAVVKKWPEIVDRGSTEGVLAGQTPGLGVVLGGKDQRRELESAGHKDIAIARPVSQVEAQGSEREPIPAASSLVHHL